jgi:hypothetical protein
MNSQINIRQAKTSDIVQLVDLMNDQYGIKKNAAYFEWQFFNSPLTTGLSIAEIDDKIIGMFGLQIKSLNDGHKIGQLIDLLIDQDHRGMGIFKLLYENTLRSFDDLCALMVLSNQSGMNACVKKLDMTVLAKIDDLTLEIDAKSGKKDTPETKNNAKNDLDLVNLSKTDAWKEWRFQKNPIYKYEEISLRNGSFMTVKIFSDQFNGVKIGDIVDLELREDIDDFSELLDRSIGFFQSQNISHINTWALPHTRLFEILRIFGFVSKPRERYFCLKTFDKKFDYLLDINQWQLAQADAEIY